MQPSTVPADSTTKVVINLTEEEREFLLSRVQHSLSVSKTNIQDKNLPEPDHTHWMNEYMLGIRLLTKLGA